MARSITDPLDERALGYIEELCIVYPDTPRDDAANVIRVLESCEERDPDLLPRLVAHVVVEARMALGSALLHPTSEHAPTNRERARALQAALGSRPHWRRLAVEENDRITAAIAERRRLRAEAEA